MEPLRLLVLLIGASILFCSSVTCQSTEPTVPPPTTLPPTDPTPTPPPTEPTEVTGTTPTTPGPTTTPEPVTTSEPDFECDPTVDGAFPHPVFCEYYYNCRAGVETLIKCQSNFLFDLRYYGCNYPEYTDCQDRTRPDGYPGTVTPPEGSTSSTTPGSGYQCPPEDGNYPDPADCTAFYQCFQGIAYHQFCPFPLRFDIPQQVCNHPGFVVCGDRPIPTSASR